jgi:hypothetical protein
VQAAAVSTFTRLLDRPSGRPLPDVLLHTACWVLGEYGHLAAGLTPAQARFFWFVDWERKGGEGGKGHRWVLGEYGHLAAGLTPAQGRRRGMHGGVSLGCFPKSPPLPT